MTKLPKISAFLLFAALPFAAQAEPRIYAYDSADNFCPAGLQPISINGVICCGTPNQSISYQAAMRHGVSTKRRSSNVGAKGAVCPEGEKGCYMN